MARQLSLPFFCSCSIWRITRVRDPRHFSHNRLEDIHQASLSPTGKGKSCRGEFCAIHSSTPWPKRRTGSSAVTDKESHEYEKAAN